MSDNKKPTKAEMVKIINGATKVLASLSYTKLKVTINTHFTADDYYFDITVFDKCSNNFTFYFYSFSDLVSIKNQLAVLVKIIKTDDFDKIKELAEL